MEGGDRTELPSARKLEELRDQGIVPYSRSAGMMLVLGTGLLATWICRSELFSWWGTFQGFIQAAGEQGSEALPAKKMLEGLRSLTGLFVWPLASAVFVVVVVGAVQTKFLFRPATLAPISARLFSLQSGGSFFGRSIRGIVVALISLCLGGAAALMLVRISLGVLRLDRFGFSQLAGISLKGAAFLACTVGTFAALVAILIEQIDFRRRHRMTRKEVDADQLEG